MTMEYLTKNKQIDWYPKPEGTEGLTPLCLNTKADSPPKVPKHNDDTTEGTQFYS